MIVIFEYCRIIIILRRNSKGMRKASHQQEIAALLERQDILTVEDFRRCCPGAPAQTVYSKIRALVREGTLSVVGRGEYVAMRKPTFRVPISTWMEQVNLLLIHECVGVDFCLSQRGANLYVQALKRDLPFLRDVLSKHYPRVVSEQDAKKVLGVLEKCIIVGPMVSDSPLQNQQDIPVPSLEKVLVDSIHDGNLNQLEAQKMAEVYPLNRNRLKRYAARRGVSEELDSLLESLNQDRIQMVSQVQRYLAKTAIDKAWIFGSFARGEETPKSDLDLLVNLDSKDKVSLLTLIRYQLDLEKIIGRDVDLIPSGSLKPFAVESAERDKYLVYERTA